MKVEKQEIERRMENFETICREAQIKLTVQRMEIFREVAASGDHPDAETVYRGVRKRMPTVSLDTVYRTLWLLHDLGLIITFGPSRERTRFDANLASHHHFVCTQCGLTRDVYSKVFDQLPLPDSIGEYGYAEGTHVEVIGICHQCEVKNKNKRKTKGANHDKKTNQ